MPTEDSAGCWARKGTQVAIVVLVLWLGAAVAGLTLLRAGGAARRRAAASAPAAAAPAASVPAGTVAAGTVAAERTAVRIGALPMSADGKPPLGPHVRVTSPPGEHPFLEFCHPALAIAGIACWLMFVLVHYRPFAWIAVGIFLVTMAVGLSWLAAGRRSAANGSEATWRFPPRLVIAHGIVVTLAIALTILTAISAST
jgi:hypothetical protein